MNRRIGLSILAAVIVVLAGLAIATHYRAKWRAGAYRQELKASGEPASVADVQPVISPEEIRTGIELIGAASQLCPRYSNAPTMKLLAPGRALAACREQVLPTDESTNVWPGLEALMAQNADVLAQLQAALAGPTGIGFRLDYSLGPSLLLPHLTRMKTSVQWLSLDAALELHAGRITNAWEDLEALTSLVGGWSKEPVMISELVRIAMAAIAINVTWEALQCPGWNDQQLELLQHQWEGLDLLSQAEHVLELERLSTTKLFEAGRHSYSAVNFQPGGSASGLAELAQVGKEMVDDPARGVRGALHRYPGYWCWTYWWSYEDEIVSGRALQGGIDAIRHARTAGIPALALADFERVAERLRTAHPGAFRWVGDSPSGFSYSPCDSVQRFLMRIRAIEIQRALLIGAIALKRYELKHGRYPGEFSALSPNFVKQLPCDPVDGKPLRYRLNSDGIFLLYSVGENRVDNGGDPEPPRDAPRQWWRGRDAVWPQPATPEQVQAEFRRATAEFKKRATPESRSSAAASALEAFRRRYGLLPPAPATNVPRMR